MQIIWKLLVRTRFTSDYTSFDGLRPSGSQIRSTHRRCQLRTCRRLACTIMTDSTPKVCYVGTVASSMLGS